MKNLFKKMLHHFYVDDLNTGVNCYDEGVKLYKKVKLKFNEANFNVR